MQLDKNSQEPLYIQLMRVIKEQIQNGQYKAGEQIPTEIQLLELYPVSRITIRRTIDELCAQGVLVKRQGKGTFVEAPKIYRKIENDNNMSFSIACQINGKKPSSHIISCNVVEAQNWQAEFLNLSGDLRLYDIERVLLADDLPIIYEHIYIPMVSVPDLQVQKLENGSFVRLLKEEYNLIASAKGRSTVEARLVPQGVASHLRMNTGEPVMILTSFMNDEKEQPLYISYEIIAGGRYRISI
ncbi:GntR family transcriptional regulator [Lachnospiraceae bacterium OttesenSCG-928-E19]|nr:GntR family transcriptional regulator [Lachnospiraceae bacterium OttesenSCG-928-E19]